MEDKKKEIKFKLIAALKKKGMPEKKAEEKAKESILGKLAKSSIFSRKS